MNKWIIIGGAGLAVLLVGYWAIGKANAAPLIPPRKDPGVQLSNDTSRWVRANVNMIQR